MSKKNKLLLSLIIFLLGSFSYSPCSFAETYTEEETFTISTYYPAPYGVYNQMQAKRIAVGDTNNSGELDAGDQPPANGQLYTARSVIFKPQSFLPAFDAGEGELVYNNSDDALYLYNGSTWVKQGGGGGCYVSYSGGCLAGFTNKGSAGWWGYCDFGDHYFFRPPGGGCYSAWLIGNIGEAFVCCQ